MDAGGSGRIICVHDAAERKERSGDPGVWGEPGVWDETKRESQEDLRRGRAEGGRNERDEGLWWRTQGVSR